MELYGKQGEVYLQHQKHGEKWKRYWLTLHPATRQGVARLELSEAIQERPSMVVKRQPDRKVVRLADCMSVFKLPPHAEACPAENMAAFCVETEDKKMVFATDKETCGEWVDVICSIAFQKHRKSSSQPVPLMEDNQIYVSREELCEFRVSVIQSEASDRCDLRGQYWLQAGEDMLILQELDSKKTVMEWPYKMLRRYGRDKMLFSIEAGRSCDSGPGTFYFETRQSEELLRLIESAINQQKSLTVAGEKHSPNLRSRSPRSPLPKRPESFTQPDSESYSPQFPDTKLPKFSNPVDPIGGTSHPNPANLYANPADALNISSSSPIGGISMLEPVYANPAVLMEREEPVYTRPAATIQSRHVLKEDQVSVRSNLHLFEPVYSDPADVIRSCPKAVNSVYAEPETTDTPKTCSTKEPVYSEVYTLHSVKANQHMEEPIYSVPEVKQGNQNATSQEHRGHEELQPIYSRVVKPPKTPQNLQPKKLDLSPKIVCEDLGIV